MLLDLEIAETRSAEHLGICVLAPNGWVKVTHVCVTVPMRVWTVTAGAYSLSCAGKHLIITPTGPVAADQLQQGMLIITRSGLVAVSSVVCSSDEQSLYDLRVDAADHVYYSGGIASHNSTGLGAAELFKLNTLPDYRSLYIAPMFEHIKTLAEKFMDMQRGSVFPAEYNTARGIKNSMYYKGSAKGGFLRLMYILTDPGKARGLSANSLVFDECVLGSTIVATVSGSVVLTSLRPGDKVMAHDNQRNVKIDTVRQIIKKGLRHTWTLTTRGGRKLTCTGNERVRTPSGWRYVAEFITAEACAICPISSKIKSSVELSHAAGEFCCEVFDNADSDLRIFALPSIPKASAEEVGGVNACSADRRKLQGLPSSKEQVLEEDTVVSIVYAGMQEVFDVETVEHHTLFADGIAVHNCQHLDPAHIDEISQVQKAYVDTRTTVFAGTSLDMDTCLEHQYQSGSRGVWHIHCECKDGWHSLGDKELIPKMMSVDGLRCPHSARLLNPMLGEFVHEDSRMLDLKQVSFHLPQLIVPEYASGEKFISIWKDFKKMSEKKFLQEVMGIPIESGVSELNEADLKACCSDRTFGQIQTDYLSGKVRYAYLFSGCDWGGSDWNPATKTKQSYTVHTIYGLTADGVMELVYACRYAGMNYQDIAGTIVEAHNKFKTFAIGTDNGGGSYYNAYMRDCGRIPTNKIISFNYTDTKLLLERIPHPEAHIMSLHRSDSISALIGDIKAQKIRWPRWDDSSGFVLDCLNMRRNIVESQSGRSVMRYVRHGSKADDFMQSTNYACMMKRIITQESIIPNRQILDELGSLFGTRQVVTSSEYDFYAGSHYSG